MTKLPYMIESHQYKQEDYLSIKLKLANENTTACVSEALATLISTNFHPYRFYFSGNLGTGKTAFIRYFLKKIGIKTLIKSPTYTLIENYIINKNESNDYINHNYINSKISSSEMHFLHSDLYRINDPQELYDLGLLEAHDALWLIEWPEKGEGILPMPDILFEFSIDMQHIHWLIIKIQITHPLAHYLKEIFVSSS